MGIPDSMVLIQALSKVAENLTKHGGSQVGFRIAAAWQELEVDRRPTLITTKEFAEFLQAEAEDLALTTPQPSSTKTTSAVAGTQPIAGAQPTIKALGGGHQSQNRHAATGGLRLDASMVSLAPSPTLGRASTSQIGVFIAPGRATSLERRRPS